MDCDHYLSQSVGCSLKQNLLSSAFRVFYILTSESKSWLLTSVGFIHVTVSGFSLQSLSSVLSS